MICSMTLRVMSRMREGEMADLMLRAGCTSLRPKPSPKTRPLLGLFVGTMSAMYTPIRYFACLDVSIGIRAQWARWGFHERCG